MLEKALDLVYPLEGEEKEDTQRETWQPDVVDPLFFKAMFCPSWVFNPWENFEKIALHEQQSSWKESIHTCIHRIFCIYFCTVPAIPSSFPHQYNSANYLCQRGIFPNSNLNLLIVMCLLGLETLLFLCLVDGSWHRLMFHFVMSGNAEQCYNAALALPHTDTWIS